MEKLYEGQIDEYERKLIQRKVISIGKKYWVEVGARTSQNKNPKQQLF